VFGDFSFTFQGGEQFLSRGTLLAFQPKKSRTAIYERCGDDETGTGKELFVRAIHFLLLHLLTPFY